MIVFGPEYKNAVLLQHEAARMRRLADDLDAIAGGASPEKIAVPDESPFLDRWGIGVRNLNCLVGYSTGHPRLPGVERLITTTDICLLSDDRKWARTRSRWYRLGDPLRQDCQRGDADGR